MRHSTIILQLGESGLRTPQKLPAPPGAPAPEQLSVQFPVSVTGIRDDRVPHGCHVNTKLMGTACDQVCLHHGSPVVAQKRQTAAKLSQIKVLPQFQFDRVPGEYLLRRHLPDGACDRSYDGAPFSPGQGLQYAYTFQKRVIAFGFVLRLSSKTPEPIETTGMWWGKMLMIIGSAWVVGMLITIFIKKGKFSKEA